MRRQEKSVYDPDCTRCPRLARFLAESHRAHPDYWSRPVGPFGAPDAAVLLVGLAPGMHGANRTGRPFTGDFAGILLYQTLYELGFATRPVSVSADDGLELRGLRISNSVKCVPPGNKPTPDEIRRCNAYLQAELAVLSFPRVIVALGRIAHDAALTALGLKRSAYPFAHGAEHRVQGPAPASETRWLVDSYHCSRYNTQTGRLTAGMFKTVLARAKILAEPPKSRPPARARAR